MDWTFEDIGSVIAENARRKAEHGSRHNPLTGEGCVSTPRRELRLSDYPDGVLWLPCEMWDKEDVVRDLARSGSVRGLVESGGGKFTQDIYFAFLLEFARCRCRYDFEYYAYTNLKIMDKLSGLPIRFVLNRGQRRLLGVFEEMRLAREPIRVILLKARQWGGSTLVQMYFLWIQTVLVKGFSSSICAHTQDAARNIMSMYNHAVESMPVEEGRVALTLSPKNGMQTARNIDGRGCSITVGSAIRPDSIRSQSVHLAHFSEVGIYPTTANNTPEELIASVTSIIPNVPLSMIVYESTAKGVGNYFHTEWLKAKRGEGRNVPVFVEWFCIDIYSCPVEGDEETFVRSLSGYERSLFSLGATLEAIQWYRLKRQELGSDDQMMQEFPSTDVEAFRHSGEMIFDRMRLEELRGGCMDAIAMGELYSRRVSVSEVKLDLHKRGELLEGLTFEERSDGHLKVWQWPDRSVEVRDRYVVVVDPGGRSSSSDPSCICVLDRYWMLYGEVPEVVAEWHGHTDIDLLAWNATQIAKWYSDALLVFESNTYDSRMESFLSDGDHSEFIFSLISDVYPHLYARASKVQVREGVPPKYGFHTNKATKRMIIDNYIALLREVPGGGGYVERCEEMINEALIYEKRSDGSYGNVSGNGNHDDRVMTRMIALYVAYEEMPLPTAVDSAGGVYVRSEGRMASI